MRWGAFFDTDLDAQLRILGVAQIVLGGVATSIGVEPQHKYLSLSKRKIGYFAVCQGPGTA